MDLSSTPLEGENKYPWTDNTEQPHSLFMQKNWNDCEIMLTVTIISENLSAIHFNRP